MVESTEDNDDIESLLLVQDDMTPAGYAKLQWIEEGTVSYDFTRDDVSVDTFGRPVMLNNAYFEEMTHDSRSGPAGTTKATTGFPDLDYVPAFQCKSWPRQAQPWLTRTRHLGFPSAEMLKRFESYGCFLVPVGQPLSSEKELQWRLSFSIQERKLMIGLNPTQYKCYVLLKMVKNDWIKSVIKAKSLTSYHCKTCIFYMLEVTREEIWKNENLVPCVLKCITMIKTWIKIGFIPNYFIPEENMWKGDTKTQVALVEILDALLEKGPDFIFRIRCDSVGKMLSQFINEGSNGMEKYKCTSELRFVPTETNTTVYVNLGEDDNPDKEIPNARGIKREVSKSEANESKRHNDMKPEQSSKADTKSEGDDVSQMSLGKQALISCELETLQDNSDNKDYSLTSETHNTQNSCDDNNEADLIVECYEGSNKKEIDKHQRYHTGERIVAVSTGVIVDIPEKNHKKDTTIVSRDGINLKLSLDKDETGSKEDIVSNDNRPLDLAIYKVHHWCIDSVIGNGKEFLDLLKESENIDACIKANQSLIKWLNKQIEKSVIYTEEEMKRAIALVLPFLRTSLGSLLMARNLMSPKDDEEMCMKDFELSMDNLVQGHQSDAQSGIIKHAAILFILGRYEDCASVLTEVDDNNEAHVTTWGRCLKPTDFVNEALCNKIRNESLSTEEVLRKSASVCVTYLPFEIGIIPDDLKYELFKSMFSEMPQNPENDEALDYVTVDSSIFLYYLQYRLYEKLGRTAEQKHALAKMVLVLQEDLNLGHPDTANNLFGRLLMEQYEMRAAWQCFCDSWKIRPHQNAAKWQMAIILSELIEVQNAIEMDILFHDDDESQTEEPFSVRDEANVLYCRTK